MKYDRQSIDDPALMALIQMLPQFGQPKRWRHRTGRYVLLSARGGISGRDIADLRCLKRPNAQQKAVGQANLLATAMHRRRCKDVHFSHAAYRYKSNLSAYQAW